MSSSPSALSRVFDGQQVRIVIRDGEPWFVASDVCAVLGYANARAALAQHCKGVAKHDIPTAGGNQAVSVIPERDLYRLVMRSRLPSAERFEEWVVGEVIPAIRKTGGYGHTDPLAALSDPATLRRLLGDYAERVELLEAEVESSRPKAEVYDRIVASGDTVGFREACKLIYAGTLAKEPEVRTAMQRWGWIQRLGGRLAPAYYGQEKGYVTSRDREVPTSDGGVRVVPELRITQRGVARAIERLGSGDLEVAS